MRLSPRTMTTEMVYIAGGGHSGSTLLEMFVSGAERHHAMGEVFQLVDRRNPITDHLASHLCSCGNPVEDCVFWGETVNALQDIPREDENGRYLRIADRFDAFYGAGHVLIDSSKAPEGLDRAALSGRFDIKVLHLVRDVRPWLVSTGKSYRRNGVATLRENVERNGVIKGSAKYLMRNPYVDARKWLSLNAEVQRVITRHGLQALRVSYERLCFDTEAVKREIEAFIGVEIAGYGIEGTRQRNHSIFGNRMRFEPEKLARIRYDNSWFHDNCWLLPYVVSPRLRRMNRQLQQR